jgi:hypothetical protein
MSKTVKTAIRFLTDETGGSVPAGPRYATVARFRSAEGEWSDRMWSVVADFTTPADKDSYVLADLRFLAEEAPQELLFPHNRFELDEGPHRVAEGEVVAVAASARTGS